MSLDVGLQIREATIDDAVAVGAFIREVWEEAGADSPVFAGATPALIDQAADPGAIRARLTAPGRRIFIARDGERVVGFAETRAVDGATTELAGIVVSRSVSRRGVGTRLVEHAIVSACCDGYASMIVRTKRTNEAAIGFYRRCGFAVIGEELERVGSLDVRAVRLARPLPRSGAG